MPATSPEAIARKRANARLRDRETGNHARRQQKYRERHAEYAVQERARLHERHQREWLLNPDNAVLCACDGEADDEGNYRWLQVYDGENYYTLIPRRGQERIDLQHAAYWFKALAQQTKKRTGKVARFYWFSFGYDMQQLVLGSPYIDNDTLAAIAQQKSKRFGAVRGADFRQDIDIPETRLSLYLGRKQTEIMFHKQDESASIYYVLRFYDVFTMSARSFVRTIEEFIPQWQDTTASEYLELVRSGKQARGQFSASGMDEQAILHYNEMELYLLHKYLTSLVALCMEVGLAPRNLAGPAPLARALLTKYQMQEHSKPAEYDTVAFQESQVVRDVLRTVTAGRIENAVQGVIPAGQLHNYDINSAHPSGEADAPCFAHGAFRRATEADFDALEAGGKNTPRGSFFHVATRVRHGRHRYNPLWMRDKNGGISYPDITNGWYQSVELLAAIKHYPDMDYAILDGWVWESSCDHARPFAPMIQETYETRATLKKADNPAQLPLKLALNSCFGVSQQQAGSYRTVDANGNTTGYKTPAFSSIFLASYITASTRAKLLAILGPYGNDVASVMTDGVYVTRALPLETNKQLGGLSDESDETTLHEYLLLSPGVMLRDDNHHKARGIPCSGDLDYDALKSAYQQGAQGWPIDYQRFCGLHEGLNYNKTSEHWDKSPNIGRFVDTDYMLDLSPFALQSKRDVLMSTTHVDGYIVYDTKRGDPRGVTESAQYKRTFDASLSLVSVETLLAMEQAESVRDVIERVGE